MTPQPEPTQWFSPHSCLRKKTMTQPEPAKPMSYPDIEELLTLVKTESKTLALRLYILKAEPEIRALMAATTAQAQEIERLKAEWVKLNEDNTTAFFECEAQGREITALKDALKYANKRICDLQGELESVHTKLKFNDTTTRTNSTSMADWNEAVEKATKGMK